MAAKIDKFKDVNNNDSTNDRRYTSSRLSTEETILQAASRCFERQGIKGTNVEEIAVEASVSRATLYRYFSNKDAIVEQISLRETERINSQIRRQLQCKASLEASLVECLFLSTRIASRNPYVKALVQDVEFTSKTATPSSPQQQAFMRSWGRLIHRAFENGEIASDLNEERVAHWLYVSLEMLLMKEEAGATSDQELRFFIQRFVVRPLLP